MSEIYVDRPLSSAAVGIRVTTSRGPVEIGWASGVRLQESFSQFAIEVLGDLYAKQHELTRIRVSGSFDHMRIYRAPLAALHNSAWLAQLSTVRMIQQYLTTFTLFNTVTGEALYEVTHYKPTDRSITLTTDGVVMENCSFVARSLHERVPIRNLDGTGPSNAPIPPEVLDTGLPSGIPA